MLTRKDITYNHLVAFRGNDGLINNNPCRFLITENDDYDENNLDYKNIITDQPLKQGDYINVDNLNYMVIDATKVLESSYTIGVFRSVLPILLGNTYKPVNVAIDKNSTVLNQTENIIDVHDQYKFIIPKLGNETSVNQQIVYDGGIYKTISVDSTRDGIYVNIAKYESEYDPHVYTISLAETTTTIVESATYQISGITCTDNGTIVTPTLTYTSSDTNIATISDSGLITALLAGTCNINVNYNGVSATLSLVVNAKPVEPVLSYSYTLSNGVSLRLAEATTFTCTKTIDGVTDTTFTGASLSYTLDSVGASALSAGKLTVTVGTTTATIQVRNKQTTSDTLKTIHLTITDSATGTIIVDNVAITIKNSTT